jgi:hypothetical protein
MLPSWFLLWAKLSIVLWSELQLKGWSFPYLQTRGWHFDLHIPTIPDEENKLFANYKEET